MVSPVDTKLQIVLLSRELINRSTLMVEMSLMGLTWIKSLQPQPLLFKGQKAEYRKFLIWISISGLGPR
jgi:hypothetical protein